MQGARRPFKNQKHKLVSNRLPLGPAGPCPEPLVPSPSHSLFTPTDPSGPGLTQEWAEGQPTCPSSRIHRRVTYCRVLLVGYTDFREQRGHQWMCWMYSSQRTAAIYNLISEKNRIVLSSLIWDFSSWVSNGSRDSQVMFTSTNGAQSVFCLFAVFYFIFFFIIICFFLLWKLICRLKTGGGGNWSR